MNLPFKLKILVAALFAGTAAAQDIPGVTSLLQAMNWQVVSCEKDGPITFDRCYLYPQSPKATVDDWETRAVGSSIVEVSPHWAAVKDEHWNLYQVANRQFMVRLKHAPQRFDVMWDSHPAFPDQKVTLQNSFQSFHSLRPQIPRSQQFFYPRHLPALLLEDHPEAEQALLVDHVARYKQLYFRIADSEVQVRQLDLTEMLFSETLRVSRKLAQAPIHRLNSPLFYGQGGFANQVVWVDQKRKVYGKTLYETVSEDGEEAGEVLDVEHLGTLPEAGVWPDAPRKSVSMPGMWAFELQDRIYLLRTDNEETETLSGLQNPKVLDHRRPWPSGEEERPVFMLVGEGKADIEKVSFWKCLQSCQRQGGFSLPFPARVLPVDGEVVLQEPDGGKALRLLLQEDGTVVANYLAPLNITGNLHNLGGSLIYPTENNRMVAVNFLGTHFEEEYFDFLFLRRFLHEEVIQPIYIDDANVVLKLDDGSRQVMTFEVRTAPYELMEVHRLMPKYYPVFELLCQKGSLAPGVCFDAKNLIRYYNARNELERAWHSFEKKELTESQLAAEITRIHANYLPGMW